MRFPRHKKQLLFIYYIIQDLKQSSQVSFDHLACIYIKSRTCPLYKHVYMLAAGVLDSKMVFFNGALDLSHDRIIPFATMLVREVEEVELDVAEVVLERVVLVVLEVLVTDVLVTVLVMDVVVMVIVVTEVVVCVVVLCVVVLTVVVLCVVVLTVVVVPVVEVVTV